MPFSPKKPYFKKPGEKSSMHTATCSKCNTSCQVPFKPNGKNPIFCSNCFHKEQAGDRAPSFGGKPTYHSTPRMGSDEVAKLLKSLDGKMDQMLEALEDLTSEA